MLLRALSSLIAIPGITLTGCTRDEPSCIPCKWNPFLHANHHATSHMEACAIRYIFQYRQVGDALQPSLIRLNPLTGATISVGLSSVDGCKLNYSLSHSPSSAVLSQLTSAISCTPEIHRLVNDNPKEENSASSPAAQTSASSLSHSGRTDQSVVRSC